MNVKKSKKSIHKILEKHKIINEIIINKYNNNNLNTLNQQ